MAAACLELIRPGSTLILDGGTTALEVARALPHDLGVTVITHSPTIAVALVDHPAEVFILGGRLFKHSVVASGAAAAEAAAQVTADLFLMGVTGVRPDTGLTTGDVDEAAMKRTLSRRAAETWVMASEEKIGAASPFPRARARRGHGDRLATPTRGIRCWPSSSARACGSCRRNSATPQASSSPEGNQQ